MSYRVQFLSIAKHDVRQAAHWYNQQRPGLGRRFTKEVRAKVSLIKNNPLNYVIRYKSVHTAPVDVFPFLIHFEFEPEKHLIIITSVAHTSLNPEKWLRRK